ncbi:hypothetical protein KFK09_019013 [Dendrobium nobile]|uniref:Uncharacterized protein n=1 Tax=Dendrobium nobile TaxID=94219 RepID=A0A8T3AW10_DENNO|nr:hypothetical protein KFK09_019013 [Dendrobium nobile]
MLKVAYMLEQNLEDKHEVPDITYPPKATQSLVTSFVKRPISAKKVGIKSGGLGVRKHTTKESNEARMKFSNAKSISSAQFFGEQNNKIDKEDQIILQKFTGATSISSADIFGHGGGDSHLDLAAADLINRFSFQASQDISSLKNMDGEIGKKLTSLASNFMRNLQDRIL